MQTTLQAVSLIKAFEGFRPGAYFCPGGILTIGYGTTVYGDGQKVQPGDEIDQIGAEEELFRYVREQVEPAMARLIKVPLQPHQRDAFASWLYNFGETNALSYSLPKLINAGASNEAICDKWMEYHFAGKEPSLGLYRRRLAEVCLWNGADWQGALRAGFDTDWRSLVPDTVTLAPADDPDLAIPRRGAPAPEPFEIPADAAPPLPPRASDELNKSERKRIEKKPKPAPTRKPPSVYTDPDTGSKPIEDSERVEGRTREREGERWLGFVRILFPAGAGPAVLGFFNSWAFWHVFALLSLGLVAGAGYGAYRLLEGRAMKEKGRAKASQLLH